MQYSFLFKLSKINVLFSLYSCVEGNIVRVAENYKMASSLVDVASVPPEIIGKIATFLPVQDVLNCTLVCKTWKVSYIKEFCECRARDVYLHLPYICMLSF